MSDIPTISIDMARKRLQRFREVVDSHGAAVGILHDHVAMRHLTGAAPIPEWPGAVAVTSEEAVAVFFASSEQQAAVDRQIVLPGTRRDRPVDHFAELSAALRPILEEAVRGGPRVALDLARAPGWLCILLTELGMRDRVVDVGQDLIALRRRKDPDEQAIIRYNVELAETGYSAASAAIRPGATEIDVYDAMSAALNRRAGTSVSMGGDFGCGPGGGSRGGPPTGRVLEEGDSYVIDFWPHLQHYYADMCRCFPVGRSSRELRDAMELATEGLRTAESLIKPGAPIRQVDAAVRKVLARRADLGGGDYFHLTGHGLGLETHEAPWLASKNDDTFVVGEVIAVEPGLYADCLKGGVRIEDNYVVVDDGVENLSSFPRVLDERGES